MSCELHAHSTLKLVQSMATQLLYGDVFQISRGFLRHGVRQVTLNVSDQSRKDVEAKRDK